MAYDAFLMIDGVQGECTAAGFAGALQIYSMAFGGQQTVNMGTQTAGSGAGKATLSPFNFMIRMEKAVLPLWLKMCKGEALPRVVLSMRKAGGAVASAPFETVTMSNVLVQGIDFSGSSGGDDAPTTSVSLVYGQIVFSYSAQNADGSLAAPVSAGWNRITNLPA